MICWLKFTLRTDLTPYLYKILYIRMILYGKLIYIYKIFMLKSCTRKNKTFLTFCKLFYMIFGAYYALFLHIIKYLCIIY